MIRIVEKHISIISKSRDIVDLYIKYDNAYKMLVDLKDIEVSTADLTFYKILIDDEFDKSEKRVSDDFI